MAHYRVELELSSQSKSDGALKLSKEIALHSWQEWQQ
jgi:hypothetical protein